MRSDTKKAEERLNEQWSEKESFLEKCHRLSRLYVKPFKHVAYVTETVTQRSDFLVTVGVAPSCGTYL